MDTNEIQSLLRAFGWPIAVDGNNGPHTKEAVSDFQHGYAFQDLAVDGNAGPKTQLALAECLDKGGKCADYFDFAEFKSKGNGWIKVHPQLLRRLDAYRRDVGPVSIVSGYRDPEHNKAVGGARNSQHTYGVACDIPGRLTIAQMIPFGFSGCGIAPGGLVVHVDVRAEGPNNTTGGDVGDPTIWYY